MRVTEIFHSIQGESTFAGQPCVFIRLTGCPLRCTWCDTAYSFHGGEEMKLEEVSARVEAYGCGLVEVTGGEPLAQAEAFPLLQRLCDQGFTVLLETSGAVDVRGVDRRVRTILDIKCPGSGMSQHMRWENLDCLQATDEIKFVLSDRADYEWARAIVLERGLTARHPVHFSPVFGQLEFRTLAEWILADRLPVRLQPQLHKFIWSPDMRGV
ncbi:7-carboxy-7-deazaguanine synthase [Nitrospira sp.]|nr:7-carboxy-7-deazaguanine synthase [Nitrospira sp.]